MEAREDAADSDDPVRLYVGVPRLFFELDGENFLGICPQGVPSEEFRYQNIYESGYWRVDGKLSSDQKLHDFREWDMGFDFYAPQTFVDGQLQTYSDRLGRHAGRAI
jgi:sucrose-6-phosphate hydrolase SacC (GH32 family)